MDSVVRISGLVQGVGFRPFIVRLAHQHGINGWVRNDAAGVTIRLQTDVEKARAFARGIEISKPPAARLDRVEVVGVADAGEQLPPVEGPGMAILPSPLNTGAPSAAVTPDLALCEDCRRELLDPSNRRYRYPFINCTNCGPRYSIIRDLPYDREKTTMASFTMCPSCREEYENVLDRRYHAQPDACPECGPAVMASDASGSLLAEGQPAIELVAAALLEGKIAAVKGLGGFHLFADARNASAVTELRSRKNRDEKPLAVMFPSLSSLDHETAPTGEELALLQSVEAPIVLVRRRPGSGLVQAVAPDNPLIGALLPYTPLHVLLMNEAGIPVVATSANISEEPLCTDNDEAVKRLGAIADIFLIHNRPIARAVDDSVVRLSESGTIQLRRARGYAPAPLMLPESCQVHHPILSTGAHLKNTIAVTLPGKVILSPHIGDLSNALAIENFRNTAGLLTGLYGGQAGSIACDLHPDYASTRYAMASGLPVIPVQHHLAHVLACLLEHGGGPERVLGVVWDGTGYGDDKTIWGGEFILVDRIACRAQRVGHLRTFQLPGGEEAIRVTGRSALGLVHSGAIDLPQSIRERLVASLGGEGKVEVLEQMLRKGLNAPVTSSAGRLFDGVASMLGLVEYNTFEGKAGMAVESTASRSRPTPSTLPWELHGNGTVASPVIVDWAPALQSIAARTAGGESTVQLAYEFHGALAQVAVAVATAIGVEAVVLTGGCFQNALLTDLTRQALSTAGHTVLLHHQLPPNDNAIAAGQALGAIWGLTRTTCAAT